MERRTSGGGEDISPTMNPHSNLFDFGRTLGGEQYVSSSQRRKSTDFLLWVAAFQCPDCSSNVRVCVLLSILTMDLFIYMTGGPGTIPMGR